jgi:hypothetical protein
MQSYVLSGGDIRIAEFNSADSAKDARFMVMAIWALVRVLQDVQAASQTGF